MADTDKDKDKDEEGQQAEQPAFTTLDLIAYRLGEIVEGQRIVLGTTALQAWMQLEAMRDKGMRAEHNAFSNTLLRLASDTLIPRPPPEPEPEGAAAVGAEAEAGADGEEGGDKAE